MKKHNTTIIDYAKKDVLKIKHSVKSEEFKKFLLRLSKKNLLNFNHFGVITKKNVEEILNNEIKRKDKIKYFSYFQNHLIAYSFLTKFEKPTKRHNSILGMIIVDEWQRKGFGIKICSHMIKHAWQKKYEKIWLTVFLDNAAAIKLYKKCGFEVEGVFLDDEKFRGVKRNVISMAIFRNSKYTAKRRNKIIKKLRV